MFILESNMKTFISGVSESVIHAYIGASIGDTLACLPSSLFIAQAESTNENVAGKSKCRWVWLYRAPWAWLAEDAGDYDPAKLQQWQSEQRAILQLRRFHKDRLLLINIDRVSPSSLAGELGFGQNVATSSVRNLTSLESTLAGLFEQAAEDYWVLYEALEAAAWLPEGEPDFRSNRSSALVHGFDEVLSLINWGRRFPAISEILNDRDKKFQGMAEELRSFHQKAEAYKREATAQIAERDQALLRLHQDMVDAKSVADHSKTDSEILLSQFHQMREELETRQQEIIVLNHQQDLLERMLSQARADHQKLIMENGVARTATVNAIEESEKLIQENLILKNESAVAESQSRSLVEENQQLLAQLHEVQEEFERHYQDGASFRLRHAELEKDFLLVNADYKKLLDDFNFQKKFSAEAQLECKKLSEAEELLRHDLKLARDKVLTLAEENDFLLVQLHESQERLETSELFNSEVIATVAQSEHTIHRARKVISRIISNA